MKSKIAYLAPLFGLLMGLGQGLYFFGYNVSTYNWTNNLNRDRFSGLNGAASALAGMLLGGILLTFFTSIVLWEPSLRSFWLFGIANSLFFPLIFVPLTTISYNVIRNNWRTAEYQTEFLSFREIPLNIGRILGILLLIYFLRTNWSALWLLWGLGLSQLPIGVVLKHVSKAEPLP